MDTFVNAPRASAAVHGSRRGEATGVAPSTDQQHLINFWGLTALPTSLPVGIQRLAAEFNASDTCRRMLSDTIERMFSVATSKSGAHLRRYGLGVGLEMPWGRWATGPRRVAIAAGGAAYVLTLFDGHALFVDRAVMWSAHRALTMYLSHDRAMRPGRSGCGLSR